MRKTVGIMLIVLIKGEMIEIGGRYGDKEKNGDCVHIV
jgi:hypothetical protein